MRPDCVVSLFDIEQNHACVFVEIISMRNVICEPSKLGYGGVSFPESELFMWH
jgi:hypothetical protein